MPPAWLMSVTTSLLTCAAEHHLDHVHGLGVGDAHALDELALLAEARQQLVDLRPAAVHDHRIHADQLQQHHVVGEAALEALVGHGVAAVLDDDGLAVKALDVGQRLGEDLGLVNRAQIRVAHRRARLGRLPIVPLSAWKKEKAAGSTALVHARSAFAAAALERWDAFRYWMVSCLAAAVAFFGSVSSSTPSEYFAVARASSSSWPSRKARETLPM